MARAGVRAIHTQVLVEAKVAAAGCGGGLSGSARPLSARRLIGNVLTRRPTDSYPSPFTGEAPFSRGLAV